MPRAIIALFVVVVFSVLVPSSAMAAKPVYSIDDVTVTATGATDTTGCTLGCLVQVDVAYTSTAKRPQWLQVDESSSDQRNGSRDWVRLDGSGEASLNVTMFAVDDTYTWTVYLIGSAGPLRPLAGPIVVGPYQANAA